MCASVEVRSLHFNLSLSAVYCPPNKAISQAQFVWFSQSLGPVFLAGRNVKHQAWGCRTTKPRGIIFYNVLSYTHHQILCAYILDYFVFNNIPNFNYTISNLNNLSSDHRPVLFVLESQPVPIPPRFDWDTVNIGIKIFINLNITLKTHEEIDSGVQIFTNIIQEAIWNNTILYLTHNCQDELDLPIDVRNLISEKIRARRI